MRIEDNFKSNLNKLIRRNPDLERAFKETIDAVIRNPLTMGKRSKFPSNSRHIGVKSHWVLWWRVEGNIITMLACGHHDDFFRR